MSIKGQKYKKNNKPKRVIVNMEKEIEEETGLGAYNKYVKNRCFICGKPIKDSLKNYLQRGHCSGDCQKSAKERNKKDSSLSYEEIVAKEKANIEVGCNGDCGNCSNYDCTNNLNNKQKH